MYDNSSRVIEVDINEILPNRFQPRIQFDEEEILELSDSIKEHGVIQPIVVRTIGDKYEIIAGERRYKASVLAGKETVPVIVKNLNDKDSAEIALIENIQRKNLTPIEEALSYKKILDMGYITQENLASKLGKSQSSVANKIRLLNLSDEVQEALLENKISERHARSLLKLTTYQQQNEMLNRIISERLTVRRADEEIEKMKNSSSDESDDESQKIIEKGEIDMNNNMFGMPNIPQNPQPTPSFDIFGGTTSTPQQPTEIPTMVNPIPEVQPVVEPIIPSIQNAPEVTQTPNFDIFGVNTSMPQQSTIQPVVAPAAEELPQMAGIQFDASGKVIAAPNIPVASSVPTVSEIPTIQPVVAPPAEELPQMAGIQFDASGKVIAAPNIPVASSVPTVSEIPTIQPVVAPAQPILTVPELTVPVTAPIMESPVVDNSTEMTQQSENLFSFGDMNSLEQAPVAQPEPTTVPEFKMPEPIIVTDYSKQYDPVMPPSPENIVPTVDFKEVINAIRECSNKIEQYGFKIDVEEYDLSNLYQVIFKIEK